MEYRLLGKTGLRVSELAFGGSEIGSEDVSDEEVDAIVSQCVEAGVNVLDTAECYGDSEEKLGRALRGRRDEVLLFTRCGHASGLDGPDWDPPMLMKSIERSLKRLQTAHVDLIQLHSCSADVLQQSDVIDVLYRARGAGKTRFIGYSGDGHDALAAIRLGVFDTLQTSVNIADQEAIELTIPSAMEAGMGIMTKRSIANAAWKHPHTEPGEYHYEYWRRLKELDYEFLRGDLRRAISVALRFPLAVPGVSTAIVGTKSASRWSENTRIGAETALETHLFAHIREVWKAKNWRNWTGQE